jgi:hypothetical protein
MVAQTHIVMDLMVRRRMMKLKEKAYNMIMDLEFMMQE